MEAESDNWATRLPFAALIVMATFTPLLVVPSLYEPTSLPQSAMLQIGALVLLGLVASVTHFPARAPSRLQLPVALLLLWSAASIFWAPNAREAAQTLSDWTAAAIVFYAATLCIRGGVDARRLMIAVFASATVVAGLGLAQFFFNIEWIPQSFPPAATFMNKNLAAEFVVIALPFGIVAFNITERALARSAIALASALLLTYLLVSYSRAAWLALALQALFILALRVRSWRRLLADPRRIALALVVVATIGFLVTQSRVVHPRLGVSLARHALAPLRAWSQCFGGKGGSVAPSASVMSVCTRIAVWRNTLVMIADRPLIGVGIGNHRVIYPKYARAAMVDPMYGESRQLARAHNEPLQLQAELGLPGFVLAAWLLIAIVSGLRRISRNDELNDVAASAALATIALCVFCSLGFPLRTPSTLLIVTLLVAIIGALGERAPTHELSHRTSVATRRATRALAAFVAILGLALAIPRHVRRIRGDSHVRQALAALTADDWTRAEGEADLALALDASRREALFARGTTLLRLDRPREAVAPLERIVAGYPYDLNSLGNLAAAHVALRDWARAKSDYSRVVALNPMDLEARASLAVACERTGDLASALAQRRFLAKYDAQSLDNHLGRALLAMRLGFLEEAELALRAALARRDDWAMAHKALGVLLYEHLGRRDEGAAHLKRALALEPGISDADRIRRLLRSSGR